VQENVVEADAAERLHRLQRRQSLPSRSVSRRHRATETLKDDPEGRMSSWLPFHVFAPAVADLPQAVTGTNTANPSACLELPKAIVTVAGRAAVTAAVWP